MLLNDIFNTQNRFHGEMLRKFTVLSIDINCSSSVCNHSTKGFTMINFESLKCFYQILAITNLKIIQEPGCKEWLYLSKELVFRHNIYVFGILIELLVYWEERHGWRFQFKSKVYTSIRKIILWHKIFILSAGKTTKLI